MLWDIFGNSTPDSQSLNGLVDQRNRAYLKPLKFFRFFIDWHLNYLIIILVQMSRVKKIEEARSLVLQHLLELEEMIPGSYKSLFRKCGRSNCWCSQQQDGHRFQRITWTEDGIAKSKAIRNEDVEWIKKVTNNFRTFQKMKRKLRGLETQLRSCIERHEKGQVQRTRKLRSYLWAGGRFVRR